MSSASFIVVAMNTVRVSASLSSASSVLIIYVIFQTEAKLSTIYHRIMFGMSCADIIGSVSIALTSLPMPRTLPEWSTMGIDNAEMDRNWQEYGTPRLGNWLTCEAQGFFFILGSFTMFYYNGVLAFYYACAIAFRMKEATIRKYVEIFLHLLAIGVGLGAAIPPLLAQNYNPTPYETTCVPKAIGCADWDKRAYCELDHIETCDDMNMDDNFVCYRGSIAMDSFQAKYYVYLLGCLLVVIFLSFGLVVCNVISMQRKLAFEASIAERIHRGMDMHPAVEARRDRTRQSVIEGHRNTKIVVFQALAYIVSFLLTLAFPLLREMTGAYVALVHKLYLIFFPLQGFFNFFIFVIHKVYNFRRVQPNASRCDVLKILFKYRGRAIEPMLISNVSLIEMGSGGNRSADEGDVENESHSYSADSGKTGGDRNGHEVSSADIASFPSNITSQRSAGNDLLIADENSKESRLSGFDSTLDGGASVATNQDESGAGVIQGDDERQPNFTRERGNKC